MTLDFVEHVIYKLANAQVHGYPFPHFFAEEVFPSDTYCQIQDYLGTDLKFDPMEGYPARAFGPVPEFLGTMESECFTMAVAVMFSSFLKKRGVSRVSRELRLIRDRRGYAIGPHTDTPRKCVSLLFYLPDHQNSGPWGTSLYLPKDRNRRCPGGPHHNRSEFDLLYTFAFKPNCCFGFWKTDNSFHGVERIEADVRRDVLLFNLYEGAK